MQSRFSQHPIARAELKHQRRSAPQRRHWLRGINRMITLAVYGAACILLASEIMPVVALASGMTRQNYADILPDWLRSVTALSVIIALVLHFRRMVQALSLSADSIARERGTNNWETLVLTGIDARRIIRGKWWATVRHLWRPYAMLGLLRAMLAVWYGAMTSRGYAFYGYGYLGNAPVTVLLFPTLLQFLLAGVAVFVLTMTNLLFTAACGLTAFNKRSGIALARAIATRLLIVASICLVGALVYHRWALTAYNSNYSGYSLIAPMIGVLFLVTLFDNGVTIGSQLASFRLSVMPPLYGSDADPLFAVYLPVVIFALLTYALLTWLLLRLAQWQAVRNGALPPLTRKSSKTAYNT